MGVVTAEMPPKLEHGEKTERVQIVAPESWVKRIEEFRASQRVGSRIPSASAVIRQLVDEALELRNASKSERQDG